MSGTVQAAPNMTTSLAFKHLNWDLTKGAYELTDSLPLMHSPGPICMIVAAYLLFILKLGPDYMRKREPFQLKTIMFSYNVAQVAISAYLALLYISSIWQWGLVPKKCHIHDSNVRDKILIAIWMYFAAKVSELLDTVFFVLRKKDNQVTFLHVYHHTIMVVATWAILKYCPTHILFYTGAINSLVHVVMYSYYALSGLGPSVAKYLWWKRYITTFQLVQFVSILFQYLATLCTSECPPSKGVAVFYASNTIFFLFLFLNFYKKAFVNKKPKIQEEGRISEETKSKKVL